MPLKDLAIVNPKILSIPAVKICEVGSILQSHGTSPGVLTRLPAVHHISPRTIEGLLDSKTKVSSSNGEIELPLCWGRNNIES